MWSFNYENYIIKILTLYSVKTEPKFFLNPSKRILSQRASYFHLI